MQVKKEVPVEVTHFSRFASAAQPLRRFGANCLDISVVIGATRNLEEVS